MSNYGLVVLNDDKFENAIRKRIKNMNADYQYINVGNERCIQKWIFHNPLGKIWHLRIKLRYEYVNKKIEENIKMELRRLTS